MATAFLTSGCEYINKVIAKDKINQGAIVYNQGRTKEAKEFFRGATELIPDNPVAWLYYGATLVKEYQELEEPKKKEVANEALAAYKKALELANNDCKTKDNAIGYIATIYSDLNDKNEQRNWLLKRAEDECATKDTKATTYYSIAVGYWQEAYDETTRYQDKAKIVNEPFHYRNMDYPDALKDKDRTLKNVDKGLEYIEKALAIDPEYVDALFYKGLLYREKQKMTKEESKRKELGEMAQKIADQATALQKKKEAEQKAKEAEKATQG
jgi:tetratricopeptide (TPR) repeat protein